jgi:hypothetical protein
LRNSNFTSSREQPCLGVRQGASSTFPFLERPLEKSPKHTDLADEILTLPDRAKQAYQLLAEVNLDIKSLAQEFPEPVKWLARFF